MSAWHSTRPAVASASKMTPAPSGFSPCSEQVRQFAGLEALQALALTEPLRMAAPHRAPSPASIGSRPNLMMRRLWKQRLRLVFFAVNGVSVFTAGLLIQVLLVRYAGMGHVSSYIAQTVASVQLSFLSSRFLTWRDRDVATLPALARFNVQQLAVTGTGMAGYAILERAGMNYIVANVAVTALLTPVSFLSSHKWSLRGRSEKAGQFSSTKERLTPQSFAHAEMKRSRRLVITRRLAIFVDGSAALAWTLYATHAALLPVMLLLISVFNFMVAGLEARWRFYTLRSPEAGDQLAWPDPVQPGQEQISFTSIVCALDEADVIGATLEGLIKQSHRRHQIIVSLRDHDTATIMAVREFEWRHPGTIDVIVGHYDLPGKHAQLNGVLPYCKGDYIGPIDSEDDVAPELLVHVEALISKTGADIVQGAVQLMNLGRTWQEWYKVHNVEEYRAWYSSRMAFQVSAGFVPLGGNTVYTRAALLREVGGWPASLTEDCAVGVLMCTRHGAKVVAAHSPELATREEVPGALFNKEIGSLFWQRVRWLQGIFQELMHATWLQMPTMRQRLLAGYILAAPILQAVSCLLIPVALITAFMLKMPVGLTMFMFTPFIPMALAILSMLIGIRTFGHDYSQRVRIRHYASIVFLTPIYQIVLAAAAVVAVGKYLRGDQGWYKTARLNQHRGQAVITAASSQEAA